MDLQTLVNYATHGVGSDRKLRWQFSVLLRQMPATGGEPYLKIIVKVFGMRALVGHTGQKFLQKERLSYPMENGELCFTSRIAHNT